MNAKEYLGQIYYLDVKIKDKSAELETYRSNLYSIKTSTDYGMKVQHSYDEDKIANLINKITDTEDEINSMIDSLILDKVHIISTIDRIKEADVYDVLHKRYVQYKSFPEIADETHHSFRWVFNQHRKGLEQIEKLIS